LAGGPVNVCGGRSSETEEEVVTDAAVLELLALLRSYLAEFPEMRSETLLAVVSDLETSLES
jgi:hypothetical protein